MNACDQCGTTEREVARSEELDVALCGDCWDHRTHSADAAMVLAGIEQVGGRYVWWPGEAERAAFTLWVAHTYAISGAHATPYLLILSPEKRSGKTRVQEVAELLVARPWRVTGASEAAIFRKIAQDRPTLLLDEIDAIFGTFSERTEPLRAILNAGNRPGATVARCAGEKGDQVRDFSVFGAKCLAGIDRGERLPDTIRDRSITITMRRKTDAEPVAALRWRDAKAETEPLRERLASWGEAVADDLLEARPEIPLELDDRAAEAWEPLLAIADLAGAEWPRRAREAAVELSASGEGEEQSLGAQLLGAIRQAFNDGDRITTAELLDAINADEELPFGGWRDGKGMDGRRLARMLRPYGVRPHTIKLPDGSTAKGYLREWFTDAWRRWAPLPTEASPASPPSPVTEAVTGAPHEQAKVTQVTQVTPISERVTEPREGDGNGHHDEAEIERLIAVAEDVEREGSR